MAITGKKNKTIKMIFLSKQFHKIAIEQGGNLSNLPLSLPSHSPNDMPTIEL